MADELLDNYLGMDQVSHRLAIHVESARRLVRQGRLPALRVGNKWLVRKDVLEAFAQRYDSRRGRRAFDNTAPRPQP